MFSLIVERCTYPDQGSLPEHVARKATSLLAELHLKREAAAKFAVFAAWRHFQFLQKNMAWAWRGQTVHALLRHVGRDHPTTVADYFRLSDHERALYLKYFLEADGGLILTFARRIGAGVSKKQLFDSLGGLIQGLYEEYIATAQDHQDKVRIKERLNEIKKRKKGGDYSRSTLPHKVQPHLEAMEDLGLVTSSVVDRETWFHPVDGARGNALSTLLDVAPDVSTLERLFAVGNPFECVARVLGTGYRFHDPGRDEAMLKAALSSGYKFLSSSTTNMASLGALSDWTCVIMLIERQVLVSPQQVLERIDQMWRESPGSVRFHVDYAGNKAYVILAEGI